MLVQFQKGSDRDKNDCQSKFSLGAAFSPNGLADALAAQAKMKAPAINVNVHFMVPYHIREDSLNLLLFHLLQKNSCES